MTIDKPPNALKDTEMFSKGTLYWPVNKLLAYKKKVRERKLHLTRIKTETSCVQQKQVSSNGEWLKGLLQVRDGSPGTGPRTVHKGRIRLC